MVLAAPSLATSSNLLYAKMMQLVKIDSPWHQEFHHVAPSSKEWNNKSAQSQLSTKPPRSRAKTSTSVVSGWRGEDTGCWPPKTRGPNNGSWLSRRKTGTNRRAQQTCLHYSVGKVLPSPFHSQVKYNTHIHIYIYSYLYTHNIYIYISIQLFIYHLVLRSCTSISQKPGQSWQFLPS